MTRRMALALAAMLTVGACSASVSTAVPATSTQATSTQATSTQAKSEPTYSVTGPTTYKVGDQVVLNHNGKPWAKITISDAKVVYSYTGGPEVEKPDQRPGATDDVFIQAWVTYEALTDGVTYSFYDWHIDCAGTVVIDAGNLLLFGHPTPALGVQGTLSSGGKHSGYAVYEVPATGEIRMSWGEYPTVFSVIIRAS